MKGRKPSASILLTVSALLLMRGALGAQERAIEFILEQDLPVPGGLYSVGVSLRGAKNLNAFEMHVTFDESKLDFVGLLDPDDELRVYNVNHFMLLGSGAPFDAEGRGGSFAVAGFLDGEKTTAPYTAGYLLFQVKDLPDLMGSRKISSTLGAIELSEVRIIDSEGFHQLPPLALQVDWDAAGVPSDFCEVHFLMFDSPSEDGIVDRVGGKACLTVISADACEIDVKVIPDVSFATLGPIQNFGDGELQLCVEFLENPHEVSRVIWLVVQAEDDVGASSQMPIMQRGACDSCTDDEVPTLPTCTVPNVAGQTQAAATTAITADSLTVGTVTPASSATVPSGSVISTTPPGGASVACNSAVNLQVSTGPGASPLPGDLNGDGEISSQEIRDVIGAFLTEDNVPGVICASLGLGAAPGCDITSQAMRDVIAAFLKQD